MSLTLAILALALVPAALSVLVVTNLGGVPDAAIAARQRQVTSTAAADLLIRQQSIETRLSAAAARPAIARLSDGIVGQSERQVARDTFQLLRGDEDAVVIGACVTRTSDGRRSVLSGPVSSCAPSRIVTRAARQQPGVVIRSDMHRVGGEAWLILATPTTSSSGGRAAVLSIQVDVAALFAETPAASAAAPSALLVDMATYDVVASATKAPVGPDALEPPTPREVGQYVSGILSSDQPTSERLASDGWVAASAPLWPSGDGSRLALIHVWPAQPSSAGAGLAIGLAALFVLTSLVCLLFTRSLMGPFRELERSRAELADKYHEARDDSLRDALTGMGNHRAFQDELEPRVRLVERGASAFSLLLIDLDNLKTVNDREGHAEGDNLLISLADSMRAAFRDSDRLYRVGGDEFAVLLPDAQPEAALEAAERLRHICSMPPTGERPTSFSGGISAVPRFAAGASQLYRQADTALYWAKRHGRGFIEVFDPDRDELHDDPGPAGVEDAVYEVARGRFFTPVFQPIVDLRSGDVLGVEGLVRPTHDNPFKDAQRLFSAAAATGRTVELDLACLEVVVGGLPRLRSDQMLSLNLSAKTLEGKDFDDGWLLDTLARSNVLPSQVVLELTERERIRDVKRLRTNVSHLEGYGIRLAADDIGADNAGLRLLSEISFDVVKLDLSLIQAEANQAPSWAVLRSLRDLAWRQGATVVGEGIERPEQLSILQRLDIPLGQGYLLQRPSETPELRRIDLSRLIAQPSDATVEVAQPSGQAVVGTGTSRPAHT